MGEGTVRESGMDMDTLLYLTWRTSKDLLDSTGDSAQCHVAAWMGGEFRGQGIRVYVCLSPLAVHLKLSQCGSSAISCLSVVKSSPVSQLFASGGQRIRASASASVLPMKTQG